MSGYRRIRTSIDDERTLARILKRGVPDSKNQPADYDNVVVLKPWGYEFEVFNNGRCAIWFLNIDARQGTSMHCHPRKDTTFIALNGNAWCQTLLGVHMIQAGQRLVVDKGVFHSIGTFSEGGLRVLECEAPADKTDLVRFTDQYGRVANGYEGRGEMVSHGLDRFGYFRFGESDADWITPNVMEVA